jgi:hypothetical protein
MALRCSKTLALVLLIATHPVHALEPNNTKEAKADWEAIASQGLIDSNTGRMFFWSRVDHSPLHVVWVRQHCEPCMRDLQAFNCVVEKVPQAQVVAVVLDAETRDEVYRHFRRTRPAYPLLIATDSLQKRLGSRLQETPEVWQFSADRNTRVRTMGARDCKYWLANLKRADPNSPN